MNLPRCARETNTRGKNVKATLRASKCFRSRCGKRNPIGGQRDFARGLCLNGAHDLALYLVDRTRLDGWMHWSGATQLLGAIAAVMATTTLFGADPDFKPLFNGKDLTGWDGDARFWSARDGMIRGETTFKALPLGNTFLIWRGGILQDFELKAKFRIHDGNSGIQYRSKDLGKWVVRGYQAEIENKPGKVGFLYEERGRKYLANVGEKVELTATGERKVVARVADKEELINKGYYKERDWNEYFIVARANRIEHWLNGFKTIELQDNDEKRRALEGVLALQIHAGPPMIVEFKDILLKQL